MLLIDYQKLYSYLVGQIDDCLQMIGNALLEEDPGRDELVEVGRVLKNAILETEENYIMASDEDEFEILLDALKKFLETQDEAQFAQSVTRVSPQKVALFEGVLNTTMGALLAARGPLPEEWQPQDPSEVEQVQ